MLTRVLIGSQAQDLATPESDRYIREAFVIQPQRLSAVAYPKRVGRETHGLHLNRSSSALDQGALLKGATVRLPPASHADGHYPRSADKAETHALLDELKFALHGSMPAIRGGARTPCLLGDLIFAPHGSRPVIAPAPGASST